MKKLQDRFGRVHDYLRISLTDRCNFRCVYCMPETPCFMKRQELLTAEEIIYLARLFVQHFGVRKIRFTGGEPLLRKEAPRIFRAISRLPVTLAITTNGMLLNRYLDLFKSIRLKNINISLDSLNPEKFANIVQRAAFARVKENIDLALEKGFHVKINVVVIKGMNDDEILDFIEWTRHLPLHVRFIEYMPFSGNRWQMEKLVSYEALLRLIREKYNIEKLEDGPHATTRAFRVSGFRGTFAVIASVSFPFCSGCNRLRLTADGKLRTCLFAREEWDLKTPLREKKALLPLIERAVWEKFAQRGGLPAFTNLETSRLSQRSMVKIGG